MEETRLLERAITSTPDQQRNSLSKNIAVVAADTGLHNDNGVLPKYIPDLSVDSMVHEGEIVETFNRGHFSAGQARKKRHPSLQ